MDPGSYPTLRDYGDSTVSPDPYFRYYGDQPNQTYGQTTDMIAQIEPLVKQLVQQELQKQYDARLSRLEKRIHDLEENYRDLAALVRSLQKSDRSATSATAKAEEGRTDVKPSPSPGFPCSALDYSPPPQVVEKKIVYTPSPELTQKHTKFMSNPCESRPTTSLAGIGKASGERLKSAGIDSAGGLVQKYQELGRDDAKFKAYMKKEAGADSLNQKRALANEQPIYPPTPVSQVVQDVEYIPSPELSQKHETFMSNPCESRPTTSLAGIGKASGERLKSAGIDSAGGLLQKYQELGRDDAKFKSYMKSTTGANSLNQNRALGNVKAFDSSSKRP